MDRAVYQIELESLDSLYGAQGALANLSPDAQRLVDSSTSTPSKVPESSPVKV